MAQAPHVGGFRAALHEVVHAAVIFALWRLNWASWWSCWAATGIWMPWCAMFSALEWRRCERITDAICGAVEDRHCRRSADEWRRMG